MKISKGGKEGRRSSASPEDKREKGKIDHSKAKALLKAGNVESARK